MFDPLSANPVPLPVPVRRPPSPQLPPRPAQPPWGELIACGLTHDSPRDERPLPPLPGKSATERFEEWIGPPDARKDIRGLLQDFGAVYGDLGPNFALVQSADTPHEIKKATRKLLLRVHPDKLSGDLQFGAMGLDGRLFAHVLETVHRFKLEQQVAEDQPLTKAAR